MNGPIHLMSPLLSCMWKFFCRMFAKIGQRMTEDVHLKKVFSNPDMVREAKVFEGMLKGLTIQPAESYDNKFCDDVRTFSTELYSKWQSKESA